MKSDSAYPSVANLRIIDIIARGGQGTVYRAHQAEHGRDVALKVLDARLLDQVALRRFDRERLALGRISDHPAIVSLLASGFTDQGDPYLLLDYAGEGSLADRLAAGAMDVDEATSMAIRLADALERAHDAGVFHRDVKPENVLGSTFAGWQLCDFGVASLTDGTRATQTVQVSMAHAAPELLDGDDASPMSDVYSLASVTFTALTGLEPMAPQPGEAMTMSLRRVVSEPFPDARPFGVPDAVAKVIESAVSKDPDVRVSSARSFAVALNAARIQLDLPEVSLSHGPALYPNATRTVVAGDVSFDPPTSPARGRGLARIAVPASLSAATIVLIAAVGVGQSGRLAIDTSSDEQAAASSLVEDDVPPAESADTGQPEVVTADVSDDALGDGTQGDAVTQVAQINDQTPPAPDAPNGGGGGQGGGGNGGGNGQGGGGNGGGNGQGGGGNGGGNGGGGGNP